MLALDNLTQSEALRAPFMPRVAYGERPRALRARSHVQEVSRLVRASVIRLLSRRPRPLGCDADDLTQHVLAHLFADEAQALNRWEPSHGVSYASYVRMIAERAAISALRRRDHNPREEHPADPYDLDERGGLDGCVEERMVERDHSRVLVQRLERELSPCGRRVLRALYAEGLSVEAASRSLGMSADALYTWRSRIRQRALLLSQEG